MVSIKEVDASTFSKVYPLLQEFEEPSPDESGWRGIFEYQWEGADSCRGYGLFDKDEVVGFIGLIFSTRVIDGRAERFCNITSWIVRQPYRGHSLFLVRPLLKLQDHTLTDLTPSRIVAEILEQFGFKELDSGLHLLLPGKVLERSRDGAGLSCTHDREALAARLEGEDRRIYQDHLPYACRHLLAEGDRGPCYVVYTLVTGASSPYCHIQYVSDLGRFAEYSMGIRAAIAKHSETRLVLVDSRFAAGADLPRTRALPFRWRKQFKSPRLAPTQVDNLYSENILLNLPNVLTEQNLQGELLKGILPWAQD